MYGHLWCILQKEGWTAHPRISQDTERSTQPIFILGWQFISKQVKWMYKHAANYS